MTHEVVDHAFNEKELLTVLAALRYWQQGPRKTSSQWEIATNYGAVKPLSNWQIGALCRRLAEKKMRTLVSV